MLNLKSTLTLQPQMTNMSKRIETLESSRIRHPKISKNHSYNYYGQVHIECHQYNYHLVYFTCDDLDEHVMSFKQNEASTFNGHHNLWVFDM